MGASRSTGSRGGGSAAEEEGEGEEEDAVDASGNGVAFGGKAGDGLASGLLVKPGGGLGAILGEVVDGGGGGGGVYCEWILQVGSKVRSRRFTVAQASQGRHPSPWRCAVLAAAGDAVCKQGPPALTTVLCRTLKLFRATDEGAYEVSS